MAKIIQLNENNQEVFITNEKGKNLFEISLIPKPIIEPPLLQGSITKDLYDEFKGKPNGFSIVYTLSGGKTHYFLNAYLENEDWISLPYRYVFRRNDNTTTFSYGYNFRVLGGSLLNNYINTGYDSGGMIDLGIISFPETFDTNIRQKMFFYRNRPFDVRHHKLVTKGWNTTLTITKYY